MDLTKIAENIVESKIGQTFFLAAIIGAGVMSAYVPIAQEVEQVAARQRIISAQQGHIMASYDSNGNGILDNTEVDQLVLDYLSR